MTPRQIRKQAIADSAHWWYCDNIVSDLHRGQLGLLRMKFPQVFILIRDEDDLFCSYEDFRDHIAEVNFFNHNDEKSLSPQQREGIIIEAWNFLSLQEEEEERLAIEREEEELIYGDEMP